MRRLIGIAAVIVLGIILLVVLLRVTSCNSNPVPVPEPNAPTPTEELAVVVFETEEPTATPTTEQSSTSTGTPTAAATVGMGVSAAQVETGTPAATSVTSSAASRAPDENPLTGLKVGDAAVLKRRPLMVRVGNDPGARPQVGLEKAEVVYEEIVEWWVTRFTAVYLSEDPEMIAPIRSARLVNLHIVPQYQGALGNSGGSDGVRWEISQSGIVDLDEYFVPQPYFYRENEGWQTRLAFNAKEARQYLQEEGLEGDVKLRGFEFDQALDVASLPQEAVGDAKEVVIPYPAVTSEARWQYDPASGKYLRFTTGEPMMAFDGSQISASNVIIYFAEHQETDIVEDVNEATSIRIIANGLGTAWLLRDGKILKGNWETNGRETPRFFFNDGQPMPLKPGNTWIQVVPLYFEIEIDGALHTRLGDETPAEKEDSTAEAPTPTKLPSPTPTPIGFRGTPTPATTEEPE